MGRIRIYAHIWFYFKKNHKKLIKGKRHLKNGFLIVFCFYVMIV